MTRNFEGRPNLILLQDLLSDIKLEVRETDDDNDPKAILPAHKAILAAYSEYFAAIFRAGIADTTGLDRFVVKVIGFSVVGISVQWGAARIQSE